jgi:hypothetical protein
VGLVGVEGTGSYGAGPARYLAAAEAMYCLRDIAARWLEADPARLGSGPRADLPIVYPDNDLDRICETFYSLLVVAHESQQHTQAARVLWRHMVQ